MNEPVEPYLSRPVRFARSVGVVASWLVWASALTLRVTNVIPQWLLALLFVFGLAPYIISIQVVEPWLMRRTEEKPNEARSGEPR